MTSTHYLFESGYDEGYRDGASQGRQDLSQWADLLNELLEEIPIARRMSVASMLRVRYPQYLIVYDSRRPKPLSIELL